MSFMESMTVAVDSCAMPPSLEEVRALLFNLQLRVVVLKEKEKLGGG
jgi:hypothetical protein